MQWINVCVRKYFPVGFKWAKEERKTLRTVNDEKSHFPLGDVSYDSVHSLKEQEL